MSAMKTRSRALVAALALASIGLVGGCGEDAAQSTTTAAKDDGELSGYTRTPTPSEVRASSLSSQNRADSVSSTSATRPARTSVPPR
jgi:hypothetical protein